MDHNMFCFQCEQTAGCTGCTSRGVCGKDAQTAQVQDRLTGALIGLARAADTSPDAGPETWQLMIEGLFATLTNVNFDPDSLNALAGRVRAEKQRLVPDCAVCTAPCGRTGDYDLAQLWGAQEDIRSLKSLLLFGSRGMAAYAYHAMVLGYRDETVEALPLLKLCSPSARTGAWRSCCPLVLELGEVNLRCMALLDKANTECFGKPTPVHVPFTVEPGPFIVVSGHDLHDLKLLLEQTAGRGISSLYARRDAPGARLPGAEKVSPSQGEFRHGMAEPAEGICGPSRADPVHDELPHAAAGQSYADRVFTTAVVAYPDIAAHRRGKGLHACHRAGAGAGRLCRRHSTSPASTAARGRPPALHSDAVLQRGGQVVEAVQVRRDPAFLPGRRLRRRTPRPQLLHGIRQARPRRTPSC